MHLLRLYLRDFRNYTEEVVEFANGINAIYGGNGQGKTSLLEAIYCLVAGRSFRTTRLSDLVGWGAASFSLEAHFIRHGVEQRLRLTSDGKAKQIFYNNTEQRSWSGLLGMFPGVVMTPDDNALAKGSPQVRRRFLDLQIAQVDPLYIHHSMRYQRALKQRNSMLKAKCFDAIDSWEAILAASGAYIAVKRSIAVIDLNDKVQRLYQAIAADEALLLLQYRTGGDDHDIHSAEDHYLRLYRRQRAREASVGYCLVGPHRDEMIITLNGQEVRYFASEGQQRSCVAALRLAEWLRMKNLTKASPLMMIDDFGIGLDGSRRERLIELTATLGQVMLTSVDPALQASQVIHIDHGSVQDH